MKLVTKDPPRFEDALGHLLREGHGDGAGYWHHDHRGTGSWSCPATKIVCDELTEDELEIAFEV